MPKKDNRDPYAEGYDVAICGQSTAACPYDYDSPEGEEWLHGHQDATESVEAEENNEKAD